MHEEDEFAIFLFTLCLYLPFAVDLMTLISGKLSWIEVVLSRCSTACIWCLIHFWAAKEREGRTNVVQWEVKWFWKILLFIPSTKGSFNNWWWNLFQREDHCLSKNLVKCNKFIIWSSLRGITCHVCLCLHWSWKGGGNGNTSEQSWAVQRHRPEEIVSKTDFSSRFVFLCVWKLEIGFTFKKNPCLSVFFLLMLFQLNSTPVLERRQMKNEE